MQSCPVRQTGYFIIPIRLASDWAVSQNIVVHTPRKHLPEHSTQVYIFEFRID